MTKIYRSEASASIHEMAEDLYRSGHIDKRTMREFDEACLAPAEPLAPEEIRAIRERELVSQPVFARYLNVSKNSGLRLGARHQAPRRPRFAAAQHRPPQGPGGDRLTLHCRIRD